MCLPVFGQSVKDLLLGEVQKEVKMGIKPQHLVFPALILEIDLKQFVGAEHK